MTAICFYLLLFTLVGCATDSPTASLQRFEYVELHMGSLFRITLYAPDKARADAVAVAGYQRVAELDNIMSDYDPHSELMQLCQKPTGTPVRVSRDLFDILQYSQKVSEESDGVFDVTVGPFVQLWRTARKKKALPAPAELAQAAKAVGYRKLVLNPRERMVTLTVPN
ncbi:MAG TPA: FAD:protein FMN transferase, partial [Verrucomicrobiae bacterium]|nr:FAD:protein FMN transferase [Verrucomicrobiae bacterium]